VFGIVNAAVRTRNSIARRFPGRTAPEHTRTPRGARWMVAVACHARHLSLSPVLRTPNINFSGRSVGTRRWVVSGASGPTGSTCERRSQAGRRSPEVSWDAYGIGGGQLAPTDPLPEKWVEMRVLALPAAATSAAAEAGQVVVLLPKSPDMKEPHPKAFGDNRATLLAPEIRSRWRGRNQ
jgi:hypothetical protein